MDASSPEQTRGHLGIEIRKTSKGEYSYDTNVSISGPLNNGDDLLRMETKLVQMLRGTDSIARDEINARRILDRPE